MKLTFKAFIIGGKCWRTFGKEKLGFLHSNLDETFWVLIVLKLLKFEIFEIQVSINFHYNSLFSQWRSFVFRFSNLFLLFKEICKLLKSKFVRNWLLEQDSTTNQTYLRKAQRIKQSYIWIFVKNAKSMKVWAYIDFTACKLLSGKIKVITIRIHNFVF